MQRVAMVDSNNLVENVIVIDETTQPTLTIPGFTLVHTDTANIGDSYDGTKFVAATPAVVVPQQVALWQAKAALQSAGLLAETNSAIAAMNNDIVTSFWANAVTLDRGSLTLADLASAINLTSAQVDALFIAAAGISL
jgi:hypothetical protein